MHFDVALNLIWAIVGAVSLLILGASELRRGATTLRSRCRRGMAVFIATVALFPCISASDDLVCLKQLNFGASMGMDQFAPQSKCSNEKPNLSLALQLESLEHSQISSSGLAPSKLSQMASVGHHLIRCCSRPVPFRSGRAPPAHLLST